VTMPCAWDVVVPSALCADWDARPQQIKDAALWLASGYLWAGTGRQYGPCPVTVRPLQSNYLDPAYRAYPVWPGHDPGVAPYPYLFAGNWFNAGCGSRCCSSRSCDVVLRGPLTEIDEVLVNGEVVPASSYRVDYATGAYRLVRTDGQCWPTCQTIEAEHDEPGAFAVTYLYGREVPEVLAIATAALACQYGKLLGGGACALPARMTRLSRQGVEVEVAPADPAEGLTGIKLVDDVISLLNPSKRRSPPVVLSPDLQEACDRWTIIPAGGS
jgi:hypothetical protein